MSKKLFVKLQAPSIELLVEAKDSSGEAAKMLVGFKRYEHKVSAEKLKEVENLSGQEAEDNFIKNEILYLKNVSVEVYDDVTGQKDSELKVADTRTAAQSAFWGGPEECLSVLVDHYLASTPWKAALTTAMFKALTNVKFEEDKLKN